jgi:hypothetical protein
MKRQIYKTKPESETLCGNGKGEMFPRAPRYEDVSMNIPRRTLSKRFLNKKNKQTRAMRISIVNVLCNKACAEIRWNCERDNEREMSSFARLSSD